MLFCIKTLRAVLQASYMHHSTTVARIQILQPLLALSCRLILDSSPDAKDGPETCALEMASSSRFETMTPTKTSCDLVVFGKYGESTPDPIGTGLH